MQNVFVVASMALVSLTLIASADAQQRPQRPQPTSAAKVTEPAVPSDYVIGPEDVLGVVFWREAEMTGDYTVRPDGMITLPLIGDLRAAGMRPESLKDTISKSAGKYLTEVNVTVVVRQINSRKVFITGQVATPGTYPLSGPRNVMQLIALAGGLTEYASTDDIMIIRNEANGSTRSFKFNYKEVARGKRLEQNIQLLPGDTVVVQ